VSAETVTVRLLEHRSVEVEGTLRGPGEEVEVSAADAEALEREGYAERVKPQRPKRR
jgi:hypothetical protein